MSSSVESSIQHPSRRSFLKAASWVAGAPWIVPSSVFGATAPSNRIHVGCIGIGNQGIGILKRFLKNDDVQVVAVCDVNTASHGYKSDDQFLGRDPGLAEVEKHYAGKTGRGTTKSCAAYHDFREVLSRDDVDAVAIVAPDHWHAVMTVLAAEAGKDIYCEKPLSLTIGQGRMMVDAARKHGRILQTGSMERSNPLTRHICQVVREGAIGEVQRVKTTIGYPNKVGPGPGWSPMRVPEGFDYDMWLGPAPKVPYHKDRCLYRFRFIKDYAGGQITNFGAHSNDLAQWGLGMDQSGPVEVEYVSADWRPEGSLFDTPIALEVRYRYANGVEMTCKSSKERMVGVRFEGTEGWIEATAYGWRAESEPASLVAEKFPDGTLAFDATTAHVRNFLDCVKSREEPAATGEIGHRSATVCNLGSIAVRLGRTVKWDPVNETFPGDEEANQMLNRPMRSPWQL